MNGGLPPGTTLGPYRLETPIGAGGMGEVYRARDTRLDRTVAIKILAPGDDPAALRERFDREARAISQLNHPHVCTLYDIGEEPPAAASGQPVRYLVMEFVDGETLAARLERGPLPLEEALRCAIQMCDALDKVHRKGIVHGDLKPGNIMLTKAGVKLLDFGLARQRRSSPPSGWPEAATQTVPLAVGSVLGTVQYLAPEQLEGHESDARSDIFASGAVVYEMVTGRKAFEGSSHAAVMASIMKQQPPPMSSVQPAVSPFLEHVVATCLAKDPDERWQNAGDVTRQLQWVASGAAVSAPRSAPSRQAASIWMAAAAAVLLAAGALAAYATFGRSRALDLPASRTSVLLPEGLRFPGAGELGGFERFAISPDGRQIAFVGEDPNGNRMLWLRPLASMQARPVPGSDGASSPFWAPDSRRLAFVSGRELKVVSPGGGLPDVIAAPASGTSGSWNDEDVILFTPTPSSPLHRVSAAGGTPEPVTSLDPSRAEILHRNPFFLPDGRHFLYVAVSAPEGEATGARGLYVGSLDGGDITRVFESGSIAKYADGRLLFVRDNRLLAQPFDPETYELTGEPATAAEQIELIGPLSGAFSVSANGVLAYQRSSGPGSQLVWFDRDGRQLNAVGEPGRYGDLELSPDGRQAIVSLLDGSTNTRDLWLFDVERGVRTKFTFDRADDVSAVWSPDATRIVFTSNRRGHFDVYQKAASGISDETLVLADDTEKYPTTWIPGSDSIIYWTFDADGTKLSVASLDGEETPGSVLNGLVNQGRLTADGRWLAYQSSESGRSEVYIVPFPSASNRWQVSISGGSFPRWTRNGRELLFVGRDNRLMSVAVEPQDDDLTVKAPVPLFAVRPVTPRSFFAPSPDGQRILLNVQQSDNRSTSITVVQNWPVALTP